MGKWFRSIKISGVQEGKASKRKDPLRGIPKANRANGMRHVVTRLDKFFSKKMKTPWKDK